MYAGQRNLTLGEAKTSISRQEIGRFQKIVIKAAQLENVSLDKVCQVIVVHDITPKVEGYARERCASSAALRMKVSSKKS